MTPEALRGERIAEATRRYASDKQSVLDHLCDLYETNWTPPEPEVDPDVAAFAEWELNQSNAGRHDGSAKHAYLAGCTRGREGAKGLVEALAEAEATLALCEHLPREDRDYGPEVEALGRRIGFGALMSSAQASWRKYVGEKGNPLGSEFVAGPCFGTVTRTLGIIRAALAAAKGERV